MSWCLYELAANPEVQEKVRSEVLKVVGSEDVVTPAHISKMPYLRDTLKETMRYLVELDCMWLHGTPLLASLTSDGCNTQQFMSYK